VDLIGVVDTDAARAAEAAGEGDDSRARGERPDSPDLFLPGRPGPVESTSAPLVDLGIQYRQLQGASVQAGPRALSLPIYPELTQTQIEQVVATIAGAL